MYVPSNENAEILGRAVTFALAAHGDQQQKIRSAPYAFHLLGVASLVLEHGGPVEVATAAILHDVLEDTSITAEALEAAFGPEVLRLVSAVSNPPTTWSGVPPEEVQRRVAEFRAQYLERIVGSDFSIQLLSAADKYHNARCFLDELRHISCDVSEGYQEDVVHGLVMAFWQRFRAKRDGTLQYYRDCAAAYSQSEHTAVRQLGRSLRAATDEMVRFY